jgi:hypothetical protein
MRWWLRIVHHQGSEPASKYADHAERRQPAASARRPFSVARNYFKAVLFQAVLFQAVLANIVRTRQRY